MYKVAFLLLFLPFFTLAEVTITEIMYDLEGSDSKREWIKVCGNEDLNGWKFNDGSNHNLVEVRGSLILTDCAVLASDATTYINENSNYSGTVIDTVMSLNNTTDTLSLINSEGGVEFSVTYTSEEGDNGFIQYSDNVSVEEVVSVGGGPVFQEEMMITTFVDVDKIVSVGADTLFEGRAYGELNEPLEGARYLWNFGNGETAEGEKVMHHYDYPGEYVVFLNTSNIDVTKLSASDRIIIKALPAEIRIKEASPEFIKLENYGSRELDLSFWIIKSGLSQFMLPENTIILPEKDLILSYSVTHLGVPDINNVSILYPNGETSSSYTPFVYKEIETTPIVIKRIIEEEVPEEEIIKEDQPAAVILSGRDDTSNSWFISLIGVIIIGIVSAIVIRRKI